MPDLLKFQKIKIVPNNKAKIRDSRSEIVRALTRDIYAEAFVKSASRGTCVEIRCNIAVVDLSYWTSVVHAAHSDRKSLESLLIGFDKICSKLSIDATGFDNFSDLVDQVIKKIE